MRIERVRVLFCLLLAASVLAAEAEPRVRMETSLGGVVLELNRDKAPKTVANFIGYVERGDYDGTIFHRVIPGFMVQGGGLEPDMTIRPDHGTVRNEADSASREFFINVDDNTHLDHKPTSCTREEVADVEAARAKGLAKPLTCDSYGYAVFGRVVEGMDVIRDIEFVETTSRDGRNNVPVEPVVIESMKLLDTATTP